MRTHLPIFSHIDGVTNLSSSQSIALYPICTVLLVHRLHVTFTRDERQKSITPPCSLNRLKQAPSPWASDYGMKELNCHAASTPGSLYTPTNNRQRHHMPWSTAPRPPPPHPQLPTHPPDACSSTCKRGWLCLQCVMTTQWSTLTQYRHTTTLPSCSKSSG